MSKQKLRRATDLLDPFLDLIATATEDETLFGVPVRQFIIDYYRDLDIADLRDEDPRQLAVAALAHLEFAMQRRSGRAKVRIYNRDDPELYHSDQRTVVEVVNDNMPFVVDSVAMAIGEMGLGLFLTVHPIFSVTRDSQGNLTAIPAPVADDEQGRTESIARFEIEYISSSAERKRLTKTIRNALADVRFAVTDWPRLVNRMTSIIAELRRSPPPIPRPVLDESIALLEWLVDENFTFLGYRRYELKPLKNPTALRPVAGSALGIPRRGSQKSPPRPLTKQMRRIARARKLLIVTKANSRATVHRPGYLDYIAVKIYDAAGKAIGEHRFLGLFTSTAYSQSPRQIPMLRRTINRVLERGQLDAYSHRGKALMHILEGYPRDELFQSTVADLARITSGILNLQDRRRVRLFVRRDIFDRFISCLVYVPKDKFNTDIRHRIEAVLKRRFGGESVDTEVQISAGVLARLYMLVRVPAGAGKQIDVPAAEAEISAVIVNWQDSLLQALIDRHGTSRGHELFDRFGSGFPVAYQEDLEPSEACEDIAFIVRIVDDESVLELQLRSPSGDKGPALRFKLMRPVESLPLSQVLPILENFGMTVVSERPYRIECADGAVVSVQDVEIVPPQTEIPDFAELAGRFEEAFRQVIDGEIENDGFNRLVWLAGLDSRKVIVIRAYCKYILQTGAPFSQAYMESVLCEHREVACLLTQVFDMRFRLDVRDDERGRRLDQLDRDLKESLDRVTSLDDDRILRTFEAIMRATLRTNFFRKMSNGGVAGHVSFKFDPGRIPDLPEPRPQFEIFVYSPEVEGVHLRAGKVARGGLRWSDRREDFRTEILGLMKAQVVKNAVIVPTGAKGGFVIKCPCLPGAPAGEAQRNVQRCYEIFIRGLLDISDNVVDHKVVPPDDVVRLDDDDPYLVVAADKGTATFSDTANGIADAYGFWLGDAFASGGSAGYDHKKMGITARGAWEAVKRHFREFGVDIQTQPFTVAGIGDMSGDVFGNGMLLSRQIRLQAAFNHRHIFLDPDPDPEISFGERERLFRRSGSTWEDYDSRLISAGGGVFDRQVKRIDLSRQAQAMLGAETGSITPPELIRLILCMNSDLLWNGGIGTYVKAGSETHMDAGDRTNDSVRVNASELHCRVVGEGGNLGLTQLARIEYARGGGRINTDSIDNSAGVDTSDREVNIKILLDHAGREKLLRRSARNRLLAAMTDDVATLVLRDNYLQTLAISVAETYAAERLMEHVELIRAFEHSGHLNRALEALPDEEDIEHRHSTGEGLCRPELSTIISYSKIHLFNELLTSDVPEDTSLTGELELYFPTRLRKRFRDQIAVHPLRREIISTLIANSMINRMGPTFVLRAQQETGADLDSIARAYSIAREIFDMRDTWAKIEALDNIVPTSAQYALLYQSTRSLRHATHWFLQRHHDDLKIASLVERLRPGVRSLLKEFGSLSRGTSRKHRVATVEQYEQLGVPDSLATRMVTLSSSVSLLDIASIAGKFNRSPQSVARVYVEIGHGLSLDWLQEQVEKLNVEGRWQAVARGNMRGAILAVQRALVTERLAGAGSGSTDALVMNWLEHCGPRIRRTKKMLLEMRSQKTVDFATLTVALAELRRLVGA